MVLSIQYLRGLASLLVLFQHVAVKGQQYAGDPLSWFTIGGVGVEIFFIISGFIMCFTTEGKTGSLHAVGKFAKNRLVRVFPLYWVLTLVALGVFLLFPDKVNIGGGGETKTMESFLLLPTEGSYLIKNGWTLSYEIFFYLIFALGLFVKGRKGLFLSVVVLGFLPLLGMIYPLSGAWYHFLTDTLLWNFLLGFGLYYLYRKVPQAPLLVALGLLIIGVGILSLNNFGLPPKLPYLDKGFPAFFLSAGLVLLEPWLIRKPVKFFQLMGDASYSLYLAHPFALAGGAILLSKLGLNAGMGIPFFLILLLLGGIVGGVLTFYWVEKPLIHVFRRK